MTVALVFFMHVPLVVLHQNLFGSVNATPLLAVPFFIYAGELMGRGSVAQRLVDFVQGGVGSVRGSLGVTTVGTSAIFGAISGASAATVATIGKVMVPAMRRAGYPETFTAGLITSVGAIDVIIPPSIPMIVYGAAAEESVARLYAAGVIPGLLIAGDDRGLRDVARAGARASAPASRSIRQRFLHATGRSLWALGAPVIILGGIYGGVFSPTEAAAVACVYAALVTAFVFRELGWRDIVEAAAATVLFTGQILIIVACAGVFAWLLTVNQVPATMTAWLQSLNVSAWMLLLAINILLLVVGCFLDPLSAILLLSPLLVPMVKAVGIDTGAFRHRGDGQSGDRPVPSAVRHQHLRRAVGARAQARDDLSRHHSVRDNLSDRAGADHLHSGDFADRRAIPARQRLIRRQQNQGGIDPMHTTPSACAAAIAAPPAFSPRCPQARSSSP